MLCLAMTATHPSFALHGPAEPRTPLVLDSPHSGVDFPADFGAAVSELALRDGEDCYVDELWQPATERGVGLLAASVPRTYIDYNRHAGDIDLELVEGGQWPYEYLPSGKARLGKALIWRTLDDGTPIYARRLGVEEIHRRIERYHRPVPPCAGEADRGDPCAVRRQLAHRLPLDERGRRRPGRRRRRQGARRHRPRRPRRHDLRAGLHRARPRASRGARLRRQGQRPVQGRRAGARLFESGRAQDEPAARGQQAPLHGREDAARRPPASPPCSATSPRWSTRCSTTPAQATRSH